METHSPLRIYKAEQPMVFATVVLLGTVLIFLFATVAELAAMALIGGLPVDRPYLSIYMAFFSGLYVLVCSLSVVKPHLLLMWSVWRFGKHWGPPMVWGLVSAGGASEDQAVEALRHGVLVATLLWWPAYGVTAILLHQLRNPPPREARPSVRRQPIEDDDEGFFAA